MSLWTDLKPEWKFIIRLMFLTYILSLDCAGIYHSDLVWIRISLFKALDIFIYFLWSWTIDHLSFLSNFSSMLRWKPCHRIYFRQTRLKATLFCLLQSFYTDVGAFSSLFLVHLNFLSHRKNVMLTLKCLRVCSKQTSPWFVRIPQL